MIAYNPSRINVGSVALQDKSDEVVVSPLYIVFSTNAEKLLPAYLVRFLKSVPGQSQVAFQSTGTVRSNLKFEALSRISIFLPALAEQERRVAKLKSIEHQISLAEKQIALLDQLVKSRFVEVFIETGKPNPVVCLGDYCKHVNNGITRRDNDTEGSIVLRLVELQEGLIDYSSVNRMVLTDREKAKFLLNDGDILFARVNGNPDNVGRCSAFFGISEPVFHNDHIIRATIAPEYFEPIYIAQFVNSPFGREQICKGLKTSAGQYTINQEGIANVQIPLPPLSLQQEFASFVSQVDKSQFVICAGTGIGDCEACPSSRIPRHLQSPQQRPNEHPRPTLWLAKELAMGLLHVVLVDHGVTKRRVNLAVPQQNLHLFDGHPLVYGLRCKRPAKLVGMHLLHPGSLPKFAQARLHAAYF